MAVSKASIPGSVRRVRLETPLVQKEAVQAKRQTRARSRMHSFVNSLRLITCPTEAHKTGVNTKKSAMYAPPQGPWLSRTGTEIVFSEKILCKNLGACAVNKRILRKGKSGFNRRALSG